MKGKEIERFETNASEKNKTGGQQRDLNAISEWVCEEFQEATAEVMVDTNGEGKNGPNCEERNNNGYCDIKGVVLKHFVDVLFQKKEDRKPNTNPQIHCSTTNCRVMEFDVVSRRNRNHRERMKF